jgi:flagellar M-ring protein FliF
MATTGRTLSKPAPAITQSPLVKLKSFWDGLGSRQKIYLGVGAAITLAVAAIFANLIASPDYKTVITGLEAADAQAVSAQLAAKKIPYIVSPDGTSISVPSDQVDAARLEAASHDSPHSGRIGYEIFDKVSWGQTEFDEKVNYQRALEGELERTIQTMSNVKSARVHLVMATDSVFVDRERSAKASVTLRLRRGAMSKDQLTAIARLVSGAVEELKPADVVIVDADSNEALGANTGSTVAGDDLEQQLTRRLIATLSPVVGADRIHATVNVDYETASSEENQEKYDPAVSAQLNMQHSEEIIGSGGGIGGVPGTSSNVPNAKGQTAGATVTTKDSGQSSKTDSATYGVNRTTRHTIQPAGRIRRLTAAVLVDDLVERKQEKGKWVEIRHKRQPQDLKLIQELAQAALGFDSTRGDLISVQNMTFDHEETPDSLPLNFADKARKSLSDFSTVIRYAMLLVLFGLVYLLMVRPIQKRALAEPLLAAVSIVTTQDKELATLPDSASVLSQRSIILKKELAEFVMAEPESSATAVRAWLREEAK